MTEPIDTETPEDIDSKLDTLRRRTGAENGHPPGPPLPPVPPVSPPLPLDPAERQKLVSENIQRDYDQIQEWINHHVASPSAQQCFRRLVSWLQLDPSLWSEQDRQQNKEGEDWDLYRENLEAVFILVYREVRLGKHINLKKYSIDDAFKNLLEGLRKQVDQKTAEINRLDKEVQRLTTENERLSQENRDDEAALTKWREIDTSPEAAKKVFEEALARLQTPPVSNP